MGNFHKDREFQSVNYTMFYATACDSLNKILEFNNYFEKVDLTLDDEYVIRSLIYESERQAITSVVFSAMTLESFINHYGAKNIQKPYFDQCLEKLDLRSKWIKIPKLVTGRCINKGGKAYSRLLNLIEFRNKLVHDKIKKKIDPFSYERNSLGEKEANESIDCVKLLISELKEIDESISTEWIL